MAISVVRINVPLLRTLIFNPDILEYDVGGRSEEIGIGLYTRFQCLCTQAFLIFDFRQGSVLDVD